MRLQRFAQLALLATALLPGQEVGVSGVGSGDNCTFLAEPEAFLKYDLRSHQAIQNRILAVDKTRNAVRTAGTPIARRNFIDNEIFDRLAAEKIDPANLSTDEELFRRLTLDISGRIPSAADVRAFVANTSASKRGDAIQKLLLSDGYVDKWTMWLGDLVENNATSVNFNRTTDGRNALYQYLSAAVSGEDSFKDSVSKLLTATGNNFDGFSPSGWILNGTAPGGPIQDQYDMTLYKAAKQFLGLGHYDCLLCHNGRGHLDALSQWGKYTNRTDAEGMAAFFSRTQFLAYTAPPGTSADLMAYFRPSKVVADNTTGSYALPTTFGNRPNRNVVGTIRAIAPVYRDGQKPANNNWRQEFARFLVNDPLFAINTVNRVWKEFFGLGLVDQVDGLDPERLDPDVKPEDGWDFQATHPRLLIKLADDFRAKGYNMRELVRTITESSAYQLSSRYEGDWDLSKVPLFARHYPRRMMGEELHDAISKATGVVTKFTVAGLPTTFETAMQLPDTSEPRSNTGSLNFLNLFSRGNRDTVARSQGATVLQSLALMNDTFVNTRFHANQSPTLQAVAKLPTPAAQLDEMYLTFLGRLPSDYEKSKALPLLTAPTTAAAKNAALEDLAWALINKLEFQFSY